MLGAYEAYLSGAARADRAAVFEEALAHPEWCPIQPQDCWTEMPGCVWSPLERRLIVLSAGSYVNVTRIIPPLVTTADEVDRALAILDKSLAAAGG